MRKFSVIPRNGKFSVESETEVLAIMESEAAAQFAVQQLNYEPARNPCDVFMQGRWTQRTQRKEAA